MERTDGPSRLGSVKVGDTVVVTHRSATMRGLVLKILATGSIPVAKVRWENGSVGRHSVTQLRTTGKD